MPQADFSYEMAHDPAGLPAMVSIFADSENVRGEVAEDLGGAGFRIAQSGDVASLLDGSAAPLGDLVLLDCPRIDAAAMAALSRLDMRIAGAGCELVVTTSLEALDAVFACFDQSLPQILVDACRAERVVAVGRVLGQVGGSRLRDLSEDDRLALLRLSEQVDTIAKRIEGLTGGIRHDDDGLTLGEHKSVFKGLGDAAKPGASAKQARMQMPDPRLVRRMIAQRQARARFFDAELFADPAWDMLLDLTAAQGEGGKVSVSSLCIASGVPATTALRWIGQMTEAGLFERADDENDRRRAFIGLSTRAADAMARYFAEIAEPLRAAA